MTSQAIERWRVDDLVRALSGGVPSGLPGGWQQWPEAAEAHRLMARAAIAAVPPYPEDRFRGRGVVICGGGRKYFPCAWVCVRALRRLGVNLPVQLWHLGGREMDAGMDRIMAGLGVETVDAQALRDRYPCRILNGWELKAYALVHAPFRELILLDADNLPVVDPFYLFDAPEFAAAGAAFWPDFGRLGPDREAWNIFDVSYRDEPEFESGQVLVDKARCWPALNLALHYNEHSDFYYHFVHGDKETFHLAFRRLGAPYAMTETPIHALDGCMCQHDFEGHRVFQHRNMDKWRLDGSNRSIYGFRDEDLCRHDLADLRDLWRDGAFRGSPAAAAPLAGKRFLYQRIGYDQREITLEVGGVIGIGGDDSERFWSVEGQGDQAVLSILGENSVTCRLAPRGAEWHGDWLAHERMPVILQPLDD